MKNMKMNATMYFHAGAIRRNSVGETIVDWSPHTRRSRAVAESEAKKLAEEKTDICNNSFCAVVEWWDRSHGLRPGQDVAAGAEEWVDGQWLAVA
jgi:hypothetical protein